MALSTGTRLGAYEVIGVLGAGGMGEVYRAHDTKLSRHVALKILPEDFATDPERLARFRREAQMLASLNHPNIAAIHSLEDTGTTQALVLELVEGPTLADRIAQGPVPPDETLTIVRQIAEALEAAHEVGIIHRDLKPANIKIRPDGVVKVLDFGLAKVLEPGGAHVSAAALTNSPTITSPAMMTGVGVLLGTAAYMSPEQAKGRAADKRCDVWAFGAVLYEMLTARRAFEGDDVSDTLARILMKEPDWTALPGTVPPAMLTVIRRCLQKDRKQRMRDIGDISLALEGAFETVAPHTTATALASTHGRRAWMAALAVAAVGMIALGVPALRHLREASPLGSPEMRLDIVTPATDNSTISVSASFALSPDGRQIVFAASGDGASRLWLRSLATTTAQPLAGTEGARYPFWAPDSRSVAFFAEGTLRRLDLGDGTPPRILAPAENGSGGTWNTDGVIVFAPSGNSVLRRVSAVGEAVAVTTLGPQQQGHTFPAFLPDGHRFLFLVLGGGPDTSGIYLGALDGSAPRRLLATGSRGVYLPAWPGPDGAPREDGWLLWMRAGTLLAQRLDVEQASLAGEPATLADGVDAVSVTATGLVAYRSLAVNPRQLTWVDRSGTARGTIGDPHRTLSNPRVSPDGRRVVVERTVQGNTDLWLLDGTRTSRFTFDAAADRFPLWSPDGTRVVFRSNRASLGDLYQRLTSGATAEEQVVTSDQLKAASSWSRDGRFLLYLSVDPQTVGDLWVVPMAGDRTPSVFLKTGFRVAYGAFSPDSRWVAYQSNESGQSEIYVRPFVAPGATGAPTVVGQLQVSLAGGIHPAWRPDGQELYYINPKGEMIAAPVTVTGATLEPGTPMVLFPTRIVSGGLDDAQSRAGRQYDIAPDGRFLINTILDDASAPITLLQNWNPDAKTP